LLAPRAVGHDAALSENGQAALEFAREWLAGAPQFVLHTSGSTGTPKPIELARAQMEASARATGKALGLHAGQVALVCLPTRYVAGRMMLVRGLVLGLSLHVVEPAADPFAGLPPTFGADFAAFVPIQMQTLLDAALVAPSDSCYADDTAAAFRYRRLLEGMHAILIGGGPVSAPLLEGIAQISAPIYHTYGMTETATHVALRRLNGPAASEAFVPLPGVELALDGRGCLAIRGAVTGGAWLQTNDLVDLRPDGTFVWQGRWDNVINTGGVKVQVESVEAAIAALQARRPDLGWAGRRCAIAGAPDARLGQVVTLVLEGPPLAPAEEAALAQALRAELDRFAVPRRFAYLPQFPVTPTGKIERRELGDRLQGL
jgi:O-succinylbenzoic acid--CoA ligase